MFSMCYSGNNVIICLDASSVKLWTEKGNGFEYFNSGALLLKSH